MRPVGGAGILAVLVWRLGAGPFVDALRRIDGWSLAAAVGIAALTTVCCAWRWSLVARGLGVAVPMRAAVPAYYRSQFLNTTLPGGVVGDVHRAVRHGRDVGDRSRGLRAVAWERSAGQVVLIVLAMTVLLVLPSPVRSSMPAAAAAIVVGAVGVVLLGRALPRREASWWRSVARAATADVRAGLLARRAWPLIVLASVVAVAGHVATFVIAARTAGSTATPARMLPLALLVLLAMGIPLNIAGWGPREGAAAWVFAAAGLGADLGVATAVVYGVLVFVASLPGAVVLVAAWFTTDGSAGVVDLRLPSGEPSLARRKGGAGG
ncbi:lysylphosphatidylglycerol synthase transmembrane domain-containing protein [Pengzhenrongella phosphoraccumulans]|uniref:lysylphosphatidylglycerol synthase transmembrane domain-containing protein n=1 Tax=Pengzhenrongella phosphoraccumulans TaxID=3114394 RepID=UPI00388F6019